MLFTRTTSMYAPLGMREDADGKIFLAAKALAGATAKTPYELLENEYGYNATALADNTHTAYFGVAEITLSSGDVGWFQIGGPCEDMITANLSMAVGHAVKITDGACADGGADYTGAAGEFAIATAATTDSTTQDVLLIPRRVLATT